MIVVMAKAQSRGTPVNSLRLRAESLSARIAGREQLQMEVLEIPAEVVFAIAVTPETLAKAYHYRLTIRDLRQWQGRPALAAAMKTVAVEPRADGGDMRWGLIISDKNGRVIESFYFNGAGTSGFMGPDPVSFAGDFFHWLNARFSPVFR